MFYYKAIALISLLFCIAYCELGFLSTRVYSSHQYQCLMESQYKFAVITVNSSKTGITNEQIQNFVQSRKSGIYPSALFNPCRNRNYTDDAFNFSQQIPRWTYNGTVYVGLANLDDETCKWNKNNHLLNCQYFTNLLQDLRNYYLQVGVAISQQQYKDYLINGNCESQFNQSLLLWITNDKQQTLQNFSNFAGWQNPFIKQIQQNVSVCGTNIDVLFKLNKQRKKNVITDEVQF